MPSSRSIASTVQRPAPISQQDFNFPPDTHLLITTPSRILSWDSQGLHTIFTSSRSGIAAATESRDGGGILAVADKHTVVLQDTKRGQERSWGLSNEGDEVRHLEYTADSKSLFLSTKVTNAVQCYSTQRHRLLSPPQMLSSPPVALAVSPSGHLMISAEGSPPVVYLKDLVQNTAATLLQAQASPAAVVVAAFHPERANIFLLGFEDGTLAVFDASRLARVEGKGSYANQEQVGKGEIGRLAELHRPAAGKEGRGRRAITGAAFLPGHKSRLVTVGTDGRCKLVDFAEGGHVLRTWHGKAPLTSVSVLASQDSNLRSTSLSGQAKQRVASLAAEVQAGALIAVGSEDGRVLLYDALGLLQARKKVSETGERILSVEWIAVSSPKPVRAALHPTQVANLLTITSPRQRSRRKGTPERQKPTTSTTNLGLNPALQPPKLDPTITSPRKFTVHPDEILEESTVRRTPSPQRQLPISAQAGAYLDLFSPVNPFIAQQGHGIPQQRVSPTGKRPRVSSQTFSRDDTPQPGTAADATTRDLTSLQLLDHVAINSSDSRPVRPSPNKNLQFKPRKASSRISPLKTKRPHARVCAQRGPPSRSSDTPEPLNPTAAANARLLRDLHQMNAKSAGVYAGGILQSYAGKDQLYQLPTTREQPELASQAAGVGGQPLQQQQQPSIPPMRRQPIQTHIYGRGGRWPTDSVDESSWDDAQEDDIWITSDEERHHRSSAGRHHLFQRPPARQTSRSRVDSKGTMGTSRGVDLDETSSIPPHETVPTAQPHASANDDFTPASEDVRNLFPRSSSLSPRKKHRSPKKRSPRRVLAETTTNAVAARQLNSPRERNRKAMNRPIDDSVPVQTAARANKAACDGCAKTSDRVRSLEGEVAHMKGEILALRAALRSNGIPAPHMPR